MIKIEKKVLEFYRRVVFGSSYKKDDNLKNLQNIEKWCFDAAGKDMSQHVLKGKTKVSKEKKWKESFLYDKFIQWHR